jgi:hypothetical protein
MTEALDALKAAKAAALVLAAEAATVLKANDAAATAASPSLVARLSWRGAG